MAVRSLNYPLGRPIFPARTLQRRRELPAGARPLVQVGAPVRAEQPIAETPDGQALLAGMDGSVREVNARAITIEGSVCLIQGLIGLGGPSVGPLGQIPRGEDLALPSVPPGAVVVYPGRLPLTLLQRAAAVGAAGIIAGSISALELEAFARVDLTALLDGLVPRPPLPLALVLTEGLGDLPMDAHLFRLLAGAMGRLALVSGATYPRANLRPEVILPAMGEDARQRADGALEAGARVRVYGGRARGMHGELVRLYDHAQPSEAGLLVRSAQVRFEDGSSAPVPLHLLDRVG